VARIVVSNKESSSFTSYFALVENLLIKIPFFLSFFLSFQICILLGHEVAEPEKPINNRVGELKKYVI